MACGFDVVDADVVEPIDAFLLPDDDKGGGVGALSDDLRVERDWAEENAIGYVFVEAVERRDFRCVQTASLRD